MDLYKKGGGTTELIYTIIVLSLIAIGWITSVYILDIMAAPMNEDLSSSRAKASYVDYHTRTASNMDAAFVIIFVLLWGAAVILAFFVDSHPVWFFLSIIALALVLVFAAIMSNTYVEYSEGLTELTSTLPMMYYVMSHLVEFIIAMAVSIFLALYGKNVL